MITLLYAVTGLLWEADSYIPMDVGFVHETAAALMLFGYYLSMAVVIEFESCST